MRRDQTLAMWREGYAFLPNRHTALGDDVIGLRLLGRRVASLRGPEAARLFYDVDLFTREGALPGPVQRTLTGLRAVHTLDGPPHRHRKEMFLALQDPAEVASVADHVLRAWKDAERDWSTKRSVVLFRDAARALMEGVASWSGVPESGTRDLHAEDMLAMVDGFGSLGRRHWRGRRARQRTERRVAETVRRVRAGEDEPAAGSMFERILQHREQDGELDDRLVAVEILNVLRPAVAVAWFVAFAAHAMHRWPDQRERLREPEEGLARAFAHEVRRFYPFAPFLGAFARDDVEVGGGRVRPGTLVLLDLFGHNHDPRLWEHPFEFRPDRFVGVTPDPFGLVAQGAGDTRTGHRCPGEDIVVRLLEDLLPRLAAASYDVPEQDLRIPLDRIPTRPRSGVVLTGFRPGD